MIPENDSRITTETITFKGASGDVTAYVARPAGNASAPGVVIIHENKGLVPHIKDVARRAAIDGFVAIAPDYMSQVGGTPANEAEGPEKAKLLNMELVKGDGLASVVYLRSRSDCTGKIGTIGFCWGGALSNQIAVNDSKLDAGVVFYGKSPEATDVPKIKAKMMLHYGSLDENINPGVPAYEEALKKAGTDYQLFMYDGGKHAFHNDENPDRHHPEHSKTAWKRSMDFLKKTLAA